MSQNIPTSNNIAVISNSISGDIVESRIIYLHDIVDDTSVLAAIEKIHQLNASDEQQEIEFQLKYGAGTQSTRKPIILDIASWGGIVYSGLNLISCIEQSITPIVTRVNGYAFSMGLMIFLAGHKRQISRHATLMYHQISGGIIGKLKDQEEDLEISKDLQKHLEDYMLERSNLKRKDLKKIYQLKRDFYISAKQAIELGIADEII